ncbi:MAG: hypothetical protein M9913_13255 [Bryobacteraceae bacterium]|nr:hypothetical protein [Solibacteraceae bacterium]MCO5351840.1 hypothetical protein [Bryobacteraceae bacterium]
MMNPHGVVYVARYKWPFRLMAVALASLLVWLRPSVSETWQSSGWFFGVGLVFLYGLAASGLLETFVRQTWLTDTGIHQRSMFGQTRFIPYAEVQELLIERDEALVVKYQNNRRLKVHAKEGHPEAIIEAMRRFLDPEIRVITV